MTRKQLEKRMHAAMASANLSIKHGNDPYATGYADALTDVLLCLSNGHNRLSRFWPLPQALPTRKALGIK